MLLIAATSYNQTSRKPANNREAAEKTVSRSTNTSSNRDSKTSSTSRATETRSTTTRTNSSNSATRTSTPTQRVNSEADNNRSNNRPTTTNTRTTRTSPETRSSSTVRTTRTSPESRGSATVRQPERNNSSTRQVSESYSNSREPNRSNSTTRPQSRSNSQVSNRTESRATAPHRTRNTVEYSSPRVYRENHTVRYHSNRPQQSVEYRRVHHAYRRPSNIEIYWTPVMHRHYLEIYPMVHHWDYHNGYRIELISAYDAMYYRGNVTTVYGRVAEVFYSRNTDEYFLYFGQYYPHQDFTVVVPGYLARRYSFRPERYFTRRHMAVTGLITSFNGEAEIVVKKSFQLDLY